MLLDIDDTLVDTNGAFRSGMAAIVARYLPHLGESGADRALAHWHADADGVYRRFVTGEPGLPAAAPAAGAGHAPRSGRARARRRRFRRLERHLRRGVPGRLAAARRRRRAARRPGGGGCPSGR
nr:hypothetical protein [Angustibacter aerolatus]